MTAKGAITPEHPWRIWLILATGIAVIAIAAVVVRATGARNEATRRLAALGSDLQRLDDAEEEAFARDGRYAAHFAPAGAADTAAFVPSPAVTVRLEVVGEGWRAVASDTVNLVGPRSCGIFRGDAVASPHRAVVRPGEVACW